MRRAITDLPRYLGYEFNNLQLLEEALMHRSYGERSNERMEFLGDSIVNFIIADQLYQRYPQRPEGDLSRMRAQLVKGETLAQLAQELKLGEYIRLGSGELKSGGTQRTSILADAFEAIIGAIYLDGGISAVENCLIQWFNERLNDPELIVQLKDPKTQLQECLQSHKYELPEYKVLSIKGEAHEQYFQVACYIKSLDISCQGEGSSRRRAEQEAARLMLSRLNFAGV